MSEPQPEITVPVFVTVAIRVSGGQRTPGVVRVPPDEASRIINDHHGVPGERAPRGFADGGADGRTIAAMMPRREGAQ